MYKGIIIIAVAMLTINCGGPDSDTGKLCELCLSVEGPCSLGCQVDDPYALCESYTASLCERGVQCGGNQDDLAFCGLDCLAMNDCEVLGVTAYPEKLQTCIDSLSDAACRPEHEWLALEQTPECVSWEEQVQAVIDDSSCH